ncbi:MAG TPA: biotin/lipoyl-binding protein, partial [Caldilineaceae bacterium]|nr:biotin/lipoyl-binding protein [Caldilineaceae bacterium]
MHGKTATTRRLLRRLLRIGAWLAAIILLIGLGVFLAESGLLPGLPSGGTTLAPVRGSGGAAGAQAIPTQQTTVPLRPATEGLGFVRAAGNLELADVRQVVVEINGVVETIHVNVGDVVEAGDLLLVLDSAEAEEAA